LYHRGGRNENAEILFKRALALNEDSVGKDHVIVANTLTNLGNILFEQRRFSETEPLYKRALAIYQQSLSPLNPSVIAALNNLAGLYFRQDDYGDALPLALQNVASGAAEAMPVVPILYQAEKKKLISHIEAIDDSFSVIQRTSQTGAAKALNA